MTNECKHSKAGELALLNRAPGLPSTVSYVYVKRQDQSAYPGQPNHHAYNILSQMNIICIKFH